MSTGQLWNLKTLHDLGSQLEISEVRPMRSTGDKRQFRKSAVLANVPGFWGSRII